AAVAQLRGDPVPGDSPALAHAIRSVAPLAELVIVPAAGIRHFEPLTVDEQRPMHATARREVIEHFFAPDTAHDAIVAVTDNRLFKHEAEPAPLAARLARQVQLVGSVVAFREAVAVEIDRKPLEIDPRVAGQQAIGERDATLRHDFAQRAGEPRVAWPASAVDLLERGVWRAAI